MEKYVLTRSMHFGFLKETFGKGSVFEIDRQNKVMVVDSSRSYNDFRDADICIRNKFLVEHDDELVQKLKKSEEDEKRVQESEMKKMDDASKKKNMVVIRSDEDLMEKSIDISWTKNRNEEKEKTENLEVIREVDAEDIRGVRVIRNTSEVEDYQVVEDKSGRMNVNKKAAPEPTVKKYSRAKETAEEILAKRKAEIAKKSGAMIQEVETDNAELEI